MSSLDKTTPNDHGNIGAELAAIAKTRAKALAAERKASRDKLKADLKKRVIELARVAAESGERRFYIHVSTCYLWSLSDNIHNVEEELWAEMKDSGIQISAGQYRSYMPRWRITCDSRSHACSNDSTWLVEF